MIINSSEKRKYIELFSKNVSKGKVDFYKKNNINFVMGKREGPWLYDIDGKKKVYNLHSNGGVFNLGHRNKQIIDTLKEALDSVDIGNHHLISKGRAQLAEKLSLSMGKDPRFTVFGVGGGEAIDLAIKTARAYTGRDEIISILGGYHGHTGFALAAGDKQYKEPFGSMAPGFKQIPLGDINAVKSAITNKTAAFIIETIPATLGMPIPDQNYLKEIEAICMQSNTMLIMDEVQTGLGRTGKVWGYQHYDINPDIVVIGKGLSGGIYPISATVMKKELEKVFKKDPFIHISTYGGSELGCITASKVLEISSDPQFLEHVNLMSKEIRDGLEQLIKKYPKYFIKVRQLGLMIGLEFSTEFFGPVITKTAFSNDLLLVYANNDTRIVQFLPPLIMEKSDIPFIMSSLEKAIKQAIKLEPLLRKGYNAKKSLKGLLGKGKD